MLPLVTCICPTSNRREFLRASIGMFTAQDYPNKRLIIVEDGEERNGDLLPPEEVYAGLGAVRPPIEFHRLGSERRSIGEKRNIAVGLAPDGLIAHWDDDDWQATRRLSAQVKALGDADLCGLDRLVFYDGREAWLYKSLRNPWLAGSSLMYSRALWEQCKFEPISNGEDVAFLDAAQAAGAHIVPVTDESLHVLMLHGGNTVERKRDAFQWFPFSADAVRGWMA